MTTRSDRPASRPADSASPSGRPDPKAAVAAGSGATAACCDPSQRATCCAPEQQAGCCGPAATTCTCA
jgi:hypothetical protein